MNAWTVVLFYWTPRLTASFHDPDKELNITRCQREDHQSYIWSNILYFVVHVLQDLQMSPSTPEQEIQSEPPLVCATVLATQWTSFLPGSLHDPDLPPVRHSGYISEARIFRRYYSSLKMYSLFLIISQGKHFFNAPTLDEMHRCTVSPSASWEAAKHFSSFLSDSHPEVTPSAYTPLFFSYPYP